MVHSIKARALSLGGVSALALAALSAQAVAQSVNYGALEELYGEAVTTSVTGKPQKASEAPADITIITQDDIRRSGAKTIPDALRFVTGLDVRQYSAAQTDVAVQGYNQAFNPRLLVLVNGRQVYLDVYGAVSWSVIPVQLEEIRQIEVVRGPNSALFGFNAASGVINIITYDPLFDSTNAATVRVGSDAQRQASAVATAHFGDVAGVRMSLGGITQHEFSPSLYPFPHTPESGTFNIDGKAQVSPDVQVMLEAGTASANETDVLPFGPTAWDEYHTTSVKAGVIADTPIGTVAVDAYRNGFTFNINLNGIDNPGTNTIYVFQASDTFKPAAAHTIRVAFEYRNNNLIGSLVEGTIGYAVYSTSAMWDWQINPALTFTNSVRLDYLTLNYSGALLRGTGLTDSAYNNATITAPSFNSGLVYKLTDDDTVRLTASRGLQVPSLIDFGIDRPPNILGPEGISGVPTLQPTAVWELELGYDRQLAAIQSLLRTSVFVQRNDDLLTSGLNTFPALQPGHGFDSLSQNTGHSDAVGGSIGVSGHSESGFRWNASYAFEVIKDYTDLNKLITTSPQNYQAGTPTSVVIVGGGYTWEKLELDAQARWQSRYTDYQYGARGLTPYYVSDYVTFNARVGYNLTDHLTVALTGQQLNTSRLVETAGPPVQRLLLASMTARF